MTETLSLTQTVLNEARFDTAIVATDTGDSLVFENSTVIGFVLSFDRPSVLIQNWKSQADSLLAKHQFQLRAAGKKAWNVYLVLLSDARTTFGENVECGLIEEDLRGTRKIVRADIKDIGDIRAALLPLLPFQSAPQLEPVNIQAEIRRRSTELEPKVVDAFLSVADTGVVLQVLEETL